MNRKLYYRIDNGDTPIVLELSGLMMQLESEASDYNEDSNNEDKPEWVIDLIFLTEDEFENLPEAY
jgi:hypothetical protein